MRANEIKGWLMINGVTPSEIARELAVSRQAVHQTINNEIASVRIRAAISSAIGKPVEEVFPITKEQST